MDFKINLIPNLTYYREAYSETIKTSLLKRLEPLFAIIVIIVGLGLMYFDEDNTLGLFPFIFSGLGVYELIKIYTSKNKWIKDRVKSNVTGQEIQIQFTDELIIHTGPFSSGNLKWTGIKSIGQTDKGIIIKPETGTVIYLPNTSFENKDQIEFIIRKGKK